MFARGESDIYGYARGGAAKRHSGRRNASRCFSAVRGKTRRAGAEDISKQTLYVVYEGEELIALYVISDESDEAYQSAVWENPDGTAYILHRFCVSPKVQNRGIGKQLLLHIEQQVKAMGYESIRLDTFVENPFAQRLYRHNGYEPRGYADWRKGRFDLMEKKL